MSDELDLQFSQPVLTQRAATTTMDTIASKAWNDWVVTMCKREIVEHEKALLKGIRQAVDELVEKKVRALEIEIGQMRADLTIQRAHAVVDLPNRRKRA
jgi:hypothetical protein